MPVRRFPMAAVLVLAALATTARAAEERYVVQMNRPEKAGDVFDVQRTIASAKTTRVTRPGQAPQVKSDEIKGELVGSEEVKSVDAHGQATSLQLVVKKLVDGSGKQLVNAGSSIQILRGEKEVTFANADGSDINPDARKLLARMYSTHRNDTPTQDDAFGTTIAQKPGDSWDVNRTKIAAFFSADARAVAPEDATGKVTLAGIEVVNGAPSMRLNGDLKLAHVKADNLPAGMTLVSGDIHAQFKLLLPVDTAKLSSDETNHDVVEMQLAANGGAMITIKNDTTRTSTSVKQGN